ncbi:hypothetical protein AVEN_40994-1 [Araneus ventricosus]|uniref:Uncharacterized protein n=1 Tax=Araneus ventricosus TaxID=182803 RepID=A0A4Y2JPM7_ARAVE|nr:hypothetical protein AVEN_40994-1 [Araneus ventricosus]
MSNGSILSPTATPRMQGRQKISRLCGLLHVKSYVVCRKLSCWCGAKIWRGRSQFRGPPRHLTVVQNFEGPSQSSPRAASKRAGFVKKETEGVNVVENFDEIDSERATDNWEDVISDASILYEDYVNVDQNVVVCGESTDADIIAQLAVNNQAESGLSEDEEDKEI